MKSFAIRVIVVLALSCGLYGCIRQNEISEIGNGNIKTVRDNDFFDSQVNGWNYTVLTYPSDYTYGNDHKIVSMDGLYFVSDGKPADINGICVFSHDGTFLNFIGMRGHSRSEYTSVRTWCVDPFRKRVVVVIPGNKVNEYDYEGNYLQTLNPKTNLDYVDQIEAVPWGGFVLKNTLNVALEDELVLLDSSWRKISSVRHRNVKVDGMYASMGNSVVVYDCGVLCMRDICDDIYRVTPEGFNVEYRLRTVNPFVKWKGQSSDELMEIQYLSGYSYVSDISYFDGSLLFSDVNGLTVWNMKTDNGLRFPQEELDMKTEMPISRAFSGYENKSFFVLRTVGEVLGEASTMTDMEWNLSAQYSDLLDCCRNLEEEGNLLVIRYFYSAK